MGIDSGLKMRALLISSFFTSIFGQAHLTRCQGVTDGFYFQNFGTCYSKTGIVLAKYESLGLAAYNWDDAVKACESKNMKLASPQTELDYYTLLWTWKKQIAERDPRGSSIVKFGFIWLGLNDRLNEKEYIDVYGRKATDLDNRFIKTYYDTPINSPDKNCVGLYFNIFNHPDWEKTAYLSFYEMDCAKSDTDGAAYGKNRADGMDQMT